MDALGDATIGSPLLVPFDGSAHAESVFPYLPLLTDGDQEIILKDTVGGLLWIALFDAVHHRGQLTTYIRPMGGKVPSVYGPSGDDPGI